MKKRLFTTLTALCLSLTLLPTAAFAAETVPTNGDDAPITQEPIMSIEVSVTNWTYGETPNAPQFTEPEGTTETNILYFWHGEYNGTGSPTPDMPQKAGHYTVMVQCKAGDKTYGGQTDFDVAKAPLTVTACDRTAYLSDAAPDFSAPAEGTDYTISGLVYDDSVTVSLTCAADMTQVGEYAIVPSISGKQAGNYDLTAVNGTLTVADRPVSAPNRFVDVPADSYFHDAVLWATETGVTGGVDDTHFGPDLDCTRAQLVTFLWRAAGSPAAAPAAAFSDVDENAYYGQAVSWAASLGIVDGYGNGTFGTGDPITREQMVTILYRYAVAVGRDVSIGQDTDLRSYSDAADVSGYAVEAFQWAVGADIVQGSKGKLMPQATCIRAQTVTMLYRLLG